MPLRGLFSMRCHQDTPRALAPSMTVKNREISVGSIPLSAADARAASGQRRRGSRGREFGRRRVRTYLVAVQRTARARGRSGAALGSSACARSRGASKRASVARIRSARCGHQWESNTSDFRCVESTGRSPPGGSGDALYIAVVISPRDDRDGRDDDGQARAPRVSREDGKAAGASAHAARMPGSHTPETRTSFAAVKRTRDADHHARSRLRATMSSSPDHAHSMSVRRGPASCGRRAHGHGGTTCRRECSRRVFCSRDQIFFLDVLFRVHESKKNKIWIS